MVVGLFYYHCGMKIVSANVQDIPVIQTIAAETWPSAYGNILSDDQIRYMLDLFYNEEALAQQMKSEHHFILAGDDGKNAGFVSFEHNYDGSKDTKLHKLYILPLLQGNGAGHRLLEAVVAAAREAGQQRIILNVNRHNIALGFYKKYGFIIDREEDIDIGNGYFMNDYILVLPL